MTAGCGFCVGTALLLRQGWRVRDGGRLVWLALAALSAAVAVRLVAASGGLAAGGIIAVMLIGLGALMLLLAKARWTAPPPVRRHRTAPADRANATDSRRIGWARVSVSGLFSLVASEGIGGVVAGSSVGGPSSRFAAALLTVPLIWPVLATWAMSDWRSIRPLAAMAVLCVLSVAIVVLELRP